MGSSEREATGRVGLHTLEIHVTASHEVDGAGA